MPEDEVLKLIGDVRPDLLVMFGTLPSGVPAVRKLIDYLREVNSCPDMQVMCCGGIYKRAEGLAEEIGADLYAPDAADAVAHRQRPPDPQGDGRPADGRPHPPHPQGRRPQGRRRRVWSTKRRAQPRSRSSVPARPAPDTPVGRRDTMKHGRPTGG